MKYLILVIALIQLSILRAGASELATPHLPIEKAEVLEVVSSSEPQIILANFLKNYPMWVKTLFVLGVGLYAFGHIWFEMKVSNGAKLLLTVAIFIVGLFWIGSMQAEEESKRKRKGQIRLFPPNSPNSKW